MLNFADNTGQERDRSASACAVSLKPSDPSSRRRQFGRCIHLDPLRLRQLRNAAR